MHGSEVTEDFIEIINIREVMKSTKCYEEAISEEPVVTGQNIGSEVLEMLKRHGLDLKICVGVSTGG